MGHMDQFTYANQILTQELGYHLEPHNAYEFRSLLSRAGIRRFTHAVKIVKLRGLSSASARHHALCQVMQSLLPTRRIGVKYRSPEAEKAKVTHRQLDKELLTKIA